MLVVAIFIIGYFAIAFEHILKLNKSAAALLTGVLCWTANIMARRGEPHLVNEELARHIGELSQILFFLLTAMTIVELIDAHDGFDLITSRVTTTNRRRLLLLITTLSFLLSAVLDNLTTSIVMMSLVRKLVADSEDRVSYGGVIIIAANAGGVWSPIGDVTTTMLWVGEQVSTTSIIKELFVPALTAVIVPMLLIGRRMKGHVRRASPGATRRQKDDGGEHVAVAGDHTVLKLPGDAAVIGRSLGEVNLRGRTGATVLTIAREVEANSSAAEADLAGTRLATEPLRPGDVLTLAGTREAIGRAVDLLLSDIAPKLTTPMERRTVLGVGVGALLFVPVFKTLTHLPPMMGILLGLGVLWLVTEIIHQRKSRQAHERPEEDEEQRDERQRQEQQRRGPLSVAGALQRVDAQSVLFFLGILLAVAALESNGTLAALSQWLKRTIGSTHLITLVIGLASSVIDNVPLVAAAQGMYPLTAFPKDHELWLFLAYCAGTGGSILIIGSAAGVAVMGIERISFGTYIRKMSLPAFFGYAAGALIYLLPRML